MNYNYNMSKIYMNKLEAKIKELEEENKELKELNVCVGCEDNPTYKARIDKAIEYIEQLEEIETYYPALTYRTYRIESKNDIVGELLDILKGKDE